MTDTNGVKTNGRWKQVSLMVAVFTGSATFLSWLVANLVAPSIREAARKDAELAIIASEGRAAKIQDSVLIELRDMRRDVMDILKRLPK